MAITREQKETQVSQLADDFSKSKLTVLVNYQGLSVQDIQDLRRQLKEQASSLRVAKVNLIKLAAAQRKLDTDVFDGPIALAFGYEDEVAPAQVLANFAKTHNSLQFVAAIDEAGTVMDAEQVKHLASLPGKDQLRGQLVGTIAAPVSGFVTVLRANLSGLVQVLNQYSQAKA